MQANAHALEHAVLMVTCKSCALPGGGHVVFKRMRLHSLERMATMGGTWRSLPSMVVMGFSLKIRHTVFSKTVYS